jgi:polyhydroxybutyrate depolymerase
MTGASNDHVTVSAAFVCLLSTFGCDSPPGSTFNLGAATGGSASGLDAAATGATSGLDAGGASSGCGVADAPIGLHFLKLVVGSDTRTYALSVPMNYSADKPQALVFGWHWYGGSGINAASTYHLESSDGTGNNRAIFAYPDGIFMVGGQSAWDLSAGGIDVVLFDALVAQISASYCVDPHRIFSTGMSYGASFTNMLGCYRGNVLRAIAPASGDAPGRSITCNGSLAAWITHGRNDTTVDFTTGGIATRDFWIARNGCSTSTVQDATTPACVDYQGCRAGLPVVWCVHDQGHSWPNTNSDCTGGVCFDAGPAVWAFFSSLGPKPMGDTP